MPALESTARDVCTDQGVQILGEYRLEGNEDSEPGNGSGGTGKTAGFPCCAALTFSCACSRSLNNCKAPSGVASQAMIGANAPFSEDSAVGVAEAHNRPWLA